MALTKPGSQLGGISGWCQFNGTGTVAINDSLNVASITDNGTGTYDIVWDTDFANNDYGYSVSGVLQSSTSQGISGTPSTTLISLLIWRNEAGTMIDAGDSAVIAIGELV